MEKIRKILQSRKTILKKEEKGLSDLVNALILMPLMIILIFTVLNVGNYLYTLSIVTNETALGARLVGLYGGEDSTIAQGNLDDMGNGHNTISEYVESRLYDTGAGICKVGIVSGTCEPPQVECDKTNIDVRPGTVVSCTVTYEYVSFLDGIDLGLSTILERPQTIKQSSVAEVSFN